jgi:preprotein translocase subunit SecF
MFILKYKKIFLGFSSLLVLVSIVGIFMFGLKFGIEFTGGSLAEFTTEPLIELSELEARLEQGFGEEYELREADGVYVLRTRPLSEDEKREMITTLSAGKTETVKIEKYDTVGPTLGDELKSKALVALALVIASITLFIAYAFRQVSEPVSSWRYGLITMIALIHDVVVTVGLFAFLGHFAGVEVDSLFLTALLVILGYSINDTIVVFDRIRENLLGVPEEKRTDQFESVIGASLSETWVRSLNTSLTTLFAAGVIYVLTSGSVENFALALLAGIASGTYSSIFVAAPLLTYFKTAKEEA